MIILVCLILSGLIGDFVQKQVYKELRGDAAKRKMCFALINMAREQAEKGTSMKGRQTAAVVNVNNFIVDEIKNERLYIKIHRFPVWTLGWCITCYEFELRWDKERVATFQLNAKRDLFNIRENKNSKFRKKLKGKGFWGVFLKWTGLSQELCQIKS